MGQNAAPSSSRAHLDHQLEPSGGASRPCVWACLASRRRRTVLSEENGQSDSVKMTARDSTCAKRREEDLSSALIIFPP